MKTIGKTHLIGLVKPPSSKSITHRAYILGALAEEKSYIFNPLQSEDTMATLNGTTKFGAKSTADPKRVEFISKMFRGSKSVDCKNSGTSLRLLTGIAGLFPEKSHLFGDESLNQRPIGLLAKALSKFGLQIEFENNTPPINIVGPPTRKEVSLEIDGDVSSQFLSSVALLATFRNAEQNTYLKVNSEMVSKPYFDLTIQMLRKHGIEVEQDDNEYVFHGNSSITNTKVPVPMDFSSAAFFFAAGALPGNKIQVKGNFSDLIQADRKLLDFLSEMGAKVRTYDDVIIVEGTELYGIDADLQSCPDLFPIMCVLGTQAVGVTKLFGAPHLRYKESNRIEAMTQILKSLGGRIIPQDDGAIIENSLISGGKTLKTQGDHRIAMASAILGTVAEKPISIVDTQSISISYPTFLSDLTSLSEENWNN